MRTKRATASSCVGIGGSLRLRLSLSLFLIAPNLKGPAVGLAYSLQAGDIGRLLGGRACIYAPRRRQSIGCMLLVRSK